MPDEPGDERSRRESRRVLFDSVAELYESSRPGYPPELIEFMVANSRVRAGAAVLEVGCGTGQLTRQLVAYDFTLSAIDIGESMIAIARRHLRDGEVRFEMTSFENLQATDGSFDLIVSATAFHWIDPQVAWTKVARLLRPDGWMAVLSTRENYDDPFSSALMDLWLSHNAAAQWATRPTPADSIAASGLFDTAVVRSHAEPGTMPAEAVFGVERTRATFISYDDRTQASFADGLRMLLDDSPEVGLRQETSLTMAQITARDDPSIAS